MSLHVNATNTPLPLTVALQNADQALRQATPYSLILDRAMESIDSQSLILTQQHLKDINRPAKLSDLMIHALMVLLTLIAHGEQWLFNIKPLFLTNWKATTSSSLLENQAPLPYL